ncbi:MAG: BamA/TamA family outer membrane protein [bacterium]|nr:BamA/TamA family outer membrane protein [bacterium]
MNSHRDNESRNGRGRAGRRPLRRAWRPLLPALVLMLTCAGATVGSAAAVAPDAPDSLAAPAVDDRRLHLAAVELVGATRTDLATVYRYLPLRPGQAIDQAALVAAVEELRAGGLFRSVDFYTRPGEGRGQLVLVLEVVEHRLDLRWAAGNTNLDGWYLVPAMVAFDNAFGDGGNLDLRWRIGLRHDAIVLRYGQPRVGDGRSYWNLEAGAGRTERPYFADGVEFLHGVDASGLTFAFGRHVDERRLVEFGLDVATVDVAHHSTAHTRSQDDTVDYGQEIPEEDLPPAIREAVGRSARASAHLDWQYDSRPARSTAGTPTGGLWGRAKGGLVVQEGRPGHATLEMDLRSYRAVPGGVLAARLRGQWVGEAAAFHDRLYLGGLYSLRGFSTGALSPPGGDTWQWAGSLEYRSPILSDARGTKLAGVLFVDAGAGGAGDVADPYTGMAVGAGYGVRMRVRWLDWIGVDVGFPLTERTLDMRFQGHASIGWSF